MTVKCPREKSSYKRLGGMGAWGFAVGNQRLARLGKIRGFLGGLRVYRTCRGFRKAR